MASLYSLNCSSLESYQSYSDYSISSYQYSHDSDLISFLDMFIDQDDTDNSNNGDEFLKKFIETDPIQLAKAQKKLTTYRKRRLANPFPKLIKTDIRNQYAMIHLNAMNCGDVNKFETCFLNRFCAPNCILRIFNSKYSYPRHKDNVSISLVGTKHMRKLYQFLHHKYPDLVFSFDDMQIKRRIDSDNIQILSKFKMKGIDPCFESRQRSLEHHDQGLNICFNNDSTHEEIETYMNNVPDLLFDGHVSMFIDQHYRICGIILM